MKRVIRVVLALLFAFIFIATNECLVRALDIEQESLDVLDQSSTITVHDTGIGDLEIAPKLEFNRVNDYITYKLVLKNNDSEKYQITSITDDNTNEAIKLAYTYPTSLDTANKEITITIKYVKPSNDPFQTVTITINLIDEDDQSSSIDVIVPDTGYQATTSAHSATLKNSIILYILPTFRSKQTDGKG